MRQEIRLIVDFIGLGLIFMVLPALGAGGMQGGCGRLDNPYGPFDYTNPTHLRDKYPIVGNAHFTPQVEALLKGESGRIESDIDYTLRAFPNHHRALHAMARLQLRDGYKPGGLWNYSADCYFDRAMRFKAGDGIVRMLYGIYLHKQGKYEEALKRHNEAKAIIPDYSELNYNIGLLYFDMKDFSSARAYAKKAYGSGYPLSGLKQRLIKVGYWDKDPSATGVTQQR